MNDLSRKVLGRTGLKVTALGYGAMELRGVPFGGPEITDDQAKLILNAVLDEGINYIDTSIDYGRSEELIGMYIAHRRSEYYLASKCGCVPGERGKHVHTATNIRAGVEHSLRLMKTDYLDVVQFHSSLSRTELEGEALDTVVALQQEGKVRFIGMSGTLPNLVEQVEMGAFDVFQIPYSALEREHEAVMNAAAAAGSGIVVRGGASRGQPTDWGQRRYYMQPGTVAKDRWEAAQLDDLLDGMSRMEFVVRYTLSNPDLGSTIIGTKDVGHLKDNIAAALKGPLPADLLASANERLAEAGSLPST